MNEVHPDDAAILDQIVNTCEEMRKHGYTIAAGSFGLDWNEEKNAFTSEKKCVCPLGAMVIDQQPDGPPKTLEAQTTVTRSAMAATGRPVEWIRGFWQGFDRITRRTHSDDWKRGFAAGQEARRRLLG